MGVEERMHVARDTVAFALQSGDELVHYILYQWFVDQQAELELLNVSSPFIEGFLLHLAKSSDHTRAQIGHELLWKHYVKLERFSSAADVIRDLALDEYAPLRQ